MRSKQVCSLIKADPGKFKIRSFTASKKRRVVFILLSLFLLAFGAATVFAFHIKSKIDHMLIPETILTERKPFPEPTVQDGADEHQTYALNMPSAGENASQSEGKTELGDVFYFLVMGLDYREGHNAFLTDTLLVMHVIPEDAVIKMLSVPRDLMVTNAAGNRVKINSLIYEGYTLAKRYAEAHPEVLVGEEVRAGSLRMEKAVLGGAMAHTRNKIEDILDIQIDYMMLVSFETVTALVDAVGGVEVYAKRSMELSDLDFYLEPGRHILNGNQALAYARFRKDTRGSGYHISDFERVQNQQEIVKAIARKVLSWNNATKALEILDILSDNVKTDMNYADMYAMIRNYYGLFDQDSFVSVPFPEHYTSDGQVTIPKEALEQLRESFRASF